MLEGIIPNAIEDRILGRLPVKIFSATLPANITSLAIVGEMKIQVFRKCGLQVKLLTDGG